MKNGTLATVEQAEPGQLVVRIDNGARVSIDQAAYAHIDHGYAVTLHKAQGATVDRAFVLASGGMDRHLVYVGMTRHRDDAALYAGRDDFRKAMKKSWVTSRVMSPPATSSRPITWFHKPFRCCALT